MTTSMAMPGGAADDPDRGRRIGKYEILTRLSMGGMAELFLAFTSGPGGFRKFVAVKQILPDGSHKKGPDGRDANLTLEDIDSGIYLRGTGKAQVNIWMWPVGSGEVYGYRTDQKQPAEVRAGVTPKKKADKPRGEWNTFEITVKGDRLWVKLNGEEVITNAQLPGIPKEGPIALQHHGSWNAKTNQWGGPPSLVQFRNISIKELK